VGQTLLNRGTPISTLYLQPVIGGDLAALKGIIKGVLEEEERNPGQIDWNFIHRHTTGFEIMRDDILATSWQQIERQSGVSKPDVIRACEIYLRSGAPMACSAMGTTAHSPAVATIQYIVNLLLLNGTVGRTGAGRCPVRGNSNVRGDLT